MCGVASIFAYATDSPLVDRDELLRIRESMVSRGPDGSLRTGRTLPGRGAWLCQGSLECFDTAVRRRALAKALKADVDAEALERLRTDFAPPDPAARQ